MSDTQKPHAWAVKACSKMWMGEFAEIDAKAEAARCGGTCYAYPLYTEPTPPDVQQPVAWGSELCPGGPIIGVICPDEHDSHEGDYTMPLYTAPPKITPPDGWAEAVASAKFAKAVQEGPPTLLTELVNAILDMDAKIRGQG
jgi:hypothetical protein